MTGSLLVSVATLEYFSASMNQNSPAINHETRPWLVMKFGGSSVASPEGWGHLAAHAKTAAESGYNVAVVVSALRGVTDLLQDFSQKCQPESLDATFREIAERHRELVTGLELPSDCLDGELDQLRQHLRACASAPGDAATAASLLGMGEILSSKLGNRFLQTRGLSSDWLDARDVLVAVPDSRRSIRSSFLSAECPVTPDPVLAGRLEQVARIHIAPGFIARNRAGETVVLGRGGSDTTAACLGAILGAERVEIWSDVPGLFTADPRRIPGARLLRLISYREAQELAAMGARALHPRALIPLRRHEIPLWLRQTDRPDLEGTKITPEARDHGAQVKAIVQRRGITLVAMEGLDMWQQVGFLADIFEVFKSHGLSVDLVSTSESNVTVTLDPDSTQADASVLDALAADLRKLCRVEILTECATVSLVGLGIRTILHRLGPALEVFEQRRIFLVSQAANDLNLTFVVESRHAERLVQQLHQQLIPGGVGGDMVFGPSWEQMFHDREKRPVGPAWWRTRREAVLAAMEGRQSGFVYNLDTVRQAAESLTALPSVDRVLYSMKANPHPAILKTVTGSGLGVECVSLAEAERALEVCPGLKPGDLLFTPNFAPREEYLEALKQGIPLTLDNPYILDHWGRELAGREVFLRLDPGSGLGHHKMVRTAGTNSKFGIPLGELQRVVRLCRAHDIRITGLHAHTGSGILHPDNWHRSLETLGEAARDLSDVRVINLGGGLGVPDRTNELPLDLAALDLGLRQLKESLVRPIEVWLEPGRFLVSEAGVLAARVTQTKGKGEIRYVGLATGMNSLIRPALYGAWHEIVNLSRIDEPGRHVWNVVGPICETGDILGLDRLLPECREGDIILIANAGAYGATMASNYNLREPAAEVILPE